MIIKTKCANIFIVSNIIMRSFWSPLNILCDVIQNFVPFYIFLIQIFFHMVEANFDLVIA
jgi:hypothetical protein